MPFHDAEYGQVFHPMRKQDPLREIDIAEVAAAEVAREEDITAIDFWALQYRTHMVAMYSDEQLAEACERFGLACEKTTEGKGFLYE